MNCLRVLIKKFRDCFSESDLYTATEVLLDWIQNEQLTLFIPELNLSVPCRAFSCWTPNNVIRIIPPELWVNLEKKSEPNCPTIAVGVAVLKAARVIYTWTDTDIFVDGKPVTFYWN